MRKMGICALWVRHWTHTTTDSDFDLRLQNILDEQFSPDMQNAVWVSDITYIWTEKGFVYLTSVMDLFSRKILAWVLSRTLEAKNVVETVQKAVGERNGVKPKVFHNDRECQYVSDEFLEATREMTNSYSKKGYLWDNACIESFHSLIKREWLNRFKIENYDQAYRYVFEYINTFYNTVRIHSHCKYQSPDEYEAAYSKRLSELKQGLAGEGEKKLCLTCPKT
ncbi:IS3 family transposase [Atopobium sp. oral taxon 416]|nr:IS3 family transposase [Atopobium sp. oral taxon 416]